MMDTHHHDDTLSGQEGKPQQGNDDDGLSSSSDSDMPDIDVSEEEMKTIIGLDTRLENNKYDYDAHTMLIHVLRRCGMRERLREARNAMHAIFPMTETMWLEWIEDEVQKIEREEDVNRVMTLMKTSLGDYMSVSLWLQYFELVKLFDSEIQSKTAQGMALMHEYMEDAVSIAGLHVVEGGRIWDAYIGFLQEQIDDAESEEKRIEAIHVTRQVYHRRLQLPLADNEEALQRYILWERTTGGEIEGPADENENENENENNKDIELDILPPNIKRDIELARKALTLRWPFEEALMKTDQTQIGSDSMLNTFLAYIDLEESGGSGDPARVACLYERSVVYLPLTSLLWMKYARFLEMKQYNSNPLPGGSIESVYRRAVRNCPWVGELWARYIRSLETFGADENKISEIYNNSLLAPLQQGDDLMNIVLARADTLRRRGPDLFPEVRQVLQDGKERLNTNYPQFIDTKLVFIEYRANLEEVSGLKMERSREKETLIYDNNALECARRVWENALASQEAYQPQTWTKFAEFEIRHGNIEKARKIFKRCMDRRLDVHAHTYVGEAWMKFEREHGSGKDHFEACMICEPIIQKAAEETAALYQQQYAQQIKEPSSLRRQKTSGIDSKKKSARGKAVHTGPPQVSDANSKRRRGEKRSEKPSSDVAHQSKKARKAENVVKKEVQQQDNGLSTSSNGKDIETGEQNKPVQDRHHMIPRKNREVCVKHLPEDITEASITQMFSSCGNIRKIKFAKDKSTGAFRGSVYLEFDTEEGPKLARSKMHDKTYHGKKLSVFLLKSQADMEHKTRNSSDNVPLLEGAASKAGMKQKLSFIPRATVAKASNAGKSNADFRKLLQ